jgi:hypothetical protein
MEPFFKLKRFGFLGYKGLRYKNAMKGLSLFTIVVTSSSSSSSSLHFFHLCLSSLLECIEDEEEEEERQAILLATSTSLLLRMSTRRPKSINRLNLHDRHKLWGKGRGLFLLCYCDYKFAQIATFHYIFSLVCI